MMKKIYSFILAAILMIAGSAQALADDAHPWAGTYTLMVTEETYINTGDSIANLYNITCPDTFKIKIEWADTCYCITEFMGYDLHNMKDGGIRFTLSDDNNATFNPSGYVMKSLKEEVKADTTIVDGDTIITPADYDRVVLWGPGSSTASISLERQSDGQIAISEFCLATSSAVGGSIYAGWYGRCVPLNGGDVKEQYDWVGYYKVTADYVWPMVDDMTFPETFIMEIKKDDWNNLYVNQFAGYDTGTPNYNALYVNPNSKDGDKATIDNSMFNVLTTLDATTYTNLVLLDGFGGQDGIALTHNSDETISIGYFNIGKSEFFATPESVCYYLGATAVKISEEEAASISAPKATAASSSVMYNVSGQRIAAPRKGQIFIQNGRKYLAK